MVALQRAEIRIVRWMCGIKLKYRFPSKELRERLGIDDIALVLQQNRLCWYGHVLRKEDDDWVKKCMEAVLVWACACEVRVSKTKRKTKEDLERGCQRGLSST